ncbi:hypothetical protein BC939DRAFT_473026 [Gamsiella multidivaricata]|uniref:uncharacterized protein n=1 Tax=Gamsiella multidivaricata TaxID=101098 RepID=UPI0022207EC7|nr:uncharacterized protein BC939DRAFT_473026 [Gamsiella multidivaricata]KAI7831456.1 hypothetical protein BC939DRAFT_473026 [Gamsiella multidivaricata]
MAWDITRSDLQLFAKSLDLTRIMRLTVNGSCFKKASFDLYRRRRFKPIVDLMVKGRAKRLVLKEIGEFYVRIGDSPKTKDPQLQQLQVLVIDSELSLKEQVKGKGRNSGARTGFETILECCSSVTELTFNADDPHIPLNLIANKISLLQRLEKSRQLTEVCIGCRPERTLAVIDLITSTRVAIIQEDGLSTLCKLGLSEDVDSMDKNIVNITIDFPNGTDAPSISTNITMRATDPAVKFSPLWEIFSRYGWSIKRLETNQAFTDDLAKLIDNDDGNKRPQLASLTLNPTSLTMDGIRRMCSAIDYARSQNIGPQLELGFCFDLLGNDLHHQKTACLIIQYQAALKSLTVHRGPTSPEMSEITITGLLRRCFPELGIFKIACSSKAELSKRCIEWVSDMFVAPPLQETPSSSAQPSSLGSPAERSLYTVSHTLKAWQSLKEIQIEHAVLNPGHWIFLIYSIDFSALENLSFKGSNFSSEQFEILVKKVSSLECVAPLKTLHVDGTDLTIKNPSELWVSILAFQNKAPNVKIEGL